MAAGRPSRIKNFWDATTPRDTGSTSDVVGRISALISCYNQYGQQVEIPNVTLGESFTGFQEMSRGVLAMAGESLNPEALDVTLMQVGPSSVDFHFDIKAGRQAGSRRRGLGCSAEEAYAALDRLVTRCCAVGEAIVLVAGHPGCELRQLTTHYGPTVEIVIDGAPRMIVDHIGLELMQMDVVQAFMRSLLLPLNNPEFTYITVSREIQGVTGMGHRVMIANEHVREFLAGGSLRMGCPTPVLVQPGFSEGNWS